jgi:hypothetical protein
MQGFFDLMYAAKAWAAGLVVAVGNVVTLAQVAAADEAISLTEAKGIWIAITEAATVALAMVAVFKKRNAVAPGG